MSINWKSYAPYFKEIEMTCKCGCGFDAINEKLMDMLMNVRIDYGKPIIINSACRCKKHNSAVGGKADSSHLTGSAIDVRCVTSSERFELIRLFIKHGFKRIGINYEKGFIHVDIDQAKPSPAIFKY